MTTPRHIHAGTTRRFAIATGLISLTIITMILWLILGASTRSEPSGVVIFTPLFAAAMALAAGLICPMDTGIRGAPLFQAMAFVMALILTVLGLFVIWLLANAFVT